MPGELLTAWTIRLALACYVAALVGWLLAAADQLPAPWAARTFWAKCARWFWTLGCLLFVIHVACAFHFYHDWSHAAAFEKTAAETEQLLGVRFGAGIYFSYLFLILWVLDVLALWFWPATETNAAGHLVAAMRWALHAYLFFIAFNGAIVFEAGPTRWAGIAACLLLGVLAVRAAYNGQGRMRNSDCGMRSGPSQG
jgi:hypothetical protein